MSGTTDFLFQGSTPVAVPTGSDTSSSFPSWLQSENFNLGNAAFSLAGQQYSPFQGPQIYNPSADTQASQSMAEQNVGSWQPSLNAASALTMDAAGNPVSATGVNFNQLGSSDINQYMNPYTQNVIGGLESASNQNLMTNILPNIQSQFTSAGQTASPQQASAEGTAIYNAESALNPAIANALQTGYSGALSTAQQQQQAGLSTQQFNSQQGLQAGEFNTGVQQAAGAQLGQLGALGQQLGAADVSSVGAAGSAQDAYQQANINTAMQNYQNQQQWPYQNLQFASNIVQGLQAPTTTQTVGTTYPSTTGASPVAAALGTAAAANSLQLAKGGHVKGALARYADGGSTKAAQSDPLATGLFDALLSTPGGSTPDPSAEVAHISYLASLGGMNVPTNLAKGGKFDGALARYATGGASTTPTASNPFPNPGNANFRNDVLVNAYANNMGRLPDAAGAASWTSLFDQGASAQNVTNQIAAAPESAINRDYQTSLGRAPDAPGLASWMAQANSGTPLSTIATNIANSPEGQTYSQNQTNSATSSATPAATLAALTQDYQTSLGRAPDQAGLVGWEQQANSGTPLSQIASGIATSPEGTAYATANPSSPGAAVYQDNASPTAQAITADYQASLGRAPDPAGLQNYLDLANNGESLSQIAGAIAGEPEALAHAGAPSTGTPFGSQPAVVNAALAPLARGGKVRKPARGALSSARRAA